MMKPPVPSRSRCPWEISRPVRVHEDQRFVLLTDKLRAAHGWRHSERTFMPYIKLPFPQHNPR